MTEKPRRGVLMALAAEGMIPVIGGCAGALAGGPEAGMMGGVMGVAVGQAVEKVINFFGARIVDRWGVWFRQQPPEVQQQALAELASTPPEEARQQASAMLDQLLIEPIAPADKEIALSYLSLLPGALDRALPREIGTGLRSLPQTMSFDEPVQLLSLLPMTLPPYPVGSDVPNTPYRLDGLLGTGGFGAVYRASTRSLQHLPLAIKFCLDRTLVQSLQRERSNLERLMKAGGQDWSPRVVRLYGYDLEHKTPYLVYEFVTGGDLIRHVAEQREKLGRALNTAEVLELITQVTEALAFAHQHGLVHRDLKPANVLVESGVLKLADFGLGGVTAARAAQVSRIGATTVDTLTPADQASLFRGAGTPLYMSPEQRRGQSPDPRHDLYSLGVMWYQLLIGDVSRELHPGWAKELTLRFGAPKSHVNLIECCVGWYDERPKHAAELLRMIRELRDEPAAAPVIQENPATAAPPPPTIQPLAAITHVARPSDELRQGLLHSLVKQLHTAHQRVESLQGWATVIWPAGAGFFVGMTILAEGGRAGPSPVTPSILTAICGGLAYYVRYWRQGNASLEVTETIRTLVAEFPGVVQDWGGEVVLRNPEMVAQLAQKLGVVSPPAVAEAALPAMQASQRKALTGRLTALGEVVERAAGFGERKPFPWLLAGLIALVLAAPAGVGAAFAYLGYRGPLSFHGYAEPGRLYGNHFFSEAGNTLDRAVYLRAQRIAGATATLIGVSTGLAVALLVFLTLARRRWHRLPLFLGVLLGAVVGGAAGGAAGGIHHFFRAPYDDYVQGVKKRYSAQSAPLTEPQYDLEERKVLTTTLLLGVGLGVVVLLSVAVALEGWHERRGQRARQEADREAERLAADFPAVTATTGGVAALKEPENIAELLRKLG